MPRVSDFELDGTTPKIDGTNCEGGLCRKVPKLPVTPSALSCNLSVSQKDTGMAHKAPGKSFREGISLVQIFRMLGYEQDPCGNAR